MPFAQVEVLCRADRDCYLPYTLFSSANAAVVRTAAVTVCYHEKPHRPHIRSADSSYCV